MRLFSLRVFVIVVAIFICFGSFIGCGYTNKSQLPADIRSIYIPTFTNAVPLSTTFTYEAGLESKVTNAVINRFIFDGNLKVVDDIKRADVVLLGEIIRYEQGPVGFRRDEGVEEYRLFIVTKLTLKKASDSSIMWVEPNFSGSADYYTTDSTNRENATDRAVEDLAHNAVNRVIEDW